MLVSPRIYPPNHDTPKTTDHRFMNIEGLWDGAYGLSSLAEKTRESNHLQMSLQRQHFLSELF